MKRTDQAKQKIAVLLMLLLGILSQTEVQAQVVIGDAETPPSEYTILQLEGIGGLRLPRMTSTARDTYLASKIGNDASAGLMIYNETTNCIEFWDGKIWNPLKKFSSLDTSQNGISGDGTSTSPFKLGGVLDKSPVTINQKGNHLFFDPTSGKFTVSNNNAFVVTSQGVGIGVATPAAALDISASSAGTGFRYNDGSAQDGYALTSDKDGYSNWQSIRFDPVEKFADVLDGVQISSTSRNNAVKISNDLTLEKGIWLVTARYVAISGTGAASLGYNAWFRLRESGSGVDANCIGIVPQFQGSQLLATPQLSFLLQVPEGGKSYALYADIYQPSTTAVRQMKILKTSSDYGDSYFSAVQLSKVVY